MCNKQEPDKTSNYKGIEYIEEEMTHPFNIVTGKIMFIEPNLSRAEAIIEYGSFSIVKVHKLDEYDQFGRKKRVLVLQSFDDRVRCPFCDRDYLVGNSRSVGCVRCGILFNKEDLTNAEVEKM